jgi:hypothetical protein
LVVLGTVGVLALVSPRFRADPPDRDARDGDARHPADDAEADDADDPEAGGGAPAAVTR